jgi:hypothetical protein
VPVLPNSCLSLTNGVQPLINPLRGLAIPDPRPSTVPCHCERTHTLTGRPCYSLLLLGHSILSLGRPAWGGQPCRRGDLVSQRGEEPNSRWWSSFDRNEDENTRWPHPRTPSGAGKETRRSTGAAGGDFGGAAGHQHLARRVGAGLQDHIGKRHRHLRGQIRNALATRRSRGRGPHGSRSSDT